MSHPVLRLAFCLLLTASVCATAAEKRVALLIGNSHYSDAPLKNPANDVKAVGDALKQLQFDVSTVLDADQKQIQRALRDFGSRANGASVAFFYYSGHGLQSNGENYLVPLKAQIDKDADIAIEGVAVNGLMRQIEDARPGAAILVLDACRDNPYAGKKGGSKGLGRIDAPSGTLVAYATTPGSTATDDGIYARYLARYLTEPGLDLKKVFDKTGQAVDQETKGKQRPRKDDGLYVDLFLNGSSANPPSTVPSQLANLDVRPAPKPPTGGGLNTSDLQAQEAAERKERQRQVEAEKQQKKQWADWQARMKRDFDSLSKQSLSRERQAQAWQRFLDSYQEDNPYSSEDDSLRSQAQSQLARLQTAPALPAATPRPAITSAAARQPGSVFRDCNDDSCPDMVWLPKGSFMMGSESGDNDEKPVHRVTINYDLAVGKYPVTFAQWDACVVAGGCSRQPEDQGWGRGNRPVINVNWHDAQEYVKWLSQKTGKTYRLLSEAEWEYAARAGTTTRYYWGDDVGSNHANCNGCGSQWDNKHTSPVGSFAPNAWGLYDKAGNVWSWVEDCYNDNYNGAPNNGRAWTGYCSQRVLRGGSWVSTPQIARVALRYGGDPADRNYYLGFRLARAKD